MHLGLGQRWKFSVAVIVVSTVIILFSSHRGIAEDAAPAAEDDIFELDAEETPVAPSEPPAEVTEVAPPAAEATEEVPTEEIPIEEAAAAPMPTPAPQTTGAAPEGYYPPDVEVEKSVYGDATERCNCEYTYLKPYRDRRQTIGFTIAGGYSSFQPMDYKPDFVVNKTFEDFYGTAESPLMEGTLGIKWNAGFGSLALELGGGSYSNAGRNESRLSVMPIRAGLILALDTLGAEPRIVPYGGGGAYQSIYEETLASQKVGGRTTVGFYWVGGLQFQINWLDEVAATEAYDDMGLENTFLYAEARSFLATGTVPDLSSDPQWGAGVRLEY